MQRGSRNVSDSLADQSPTSWYSAAGRRSFKDRAEHTRQAWARSQRAAQLYTPLATQLATFTSHTTSVLRTPLSRPRSWTIGGKEEGQKSQQPLQQAEKGNRGERRQGTTAAKKKKPGTTPSTRAPLSLSLRSHARALRQFRENPAAWASERRPALSEFSMPHFFGWRDSLPGYIEYAWKAWRQQEGNGTMNDPIGPLQAKRPPVVTF